MKLRYTPAAFTELRELLDFVASSSPQGARRIHHQLHATTLMLRHHPHAGTLTSLRGLRRIIVAPFPYVIFYRPMPDAIEIIAVRHTARSPASMPSD